LCCTSFIDYVQVFLDSGREPQIQCEFSLIISEQKSSVLLKGYQGFSFGAAQSVGVEQQKLVPTLDSNSTSKANFP